MPTPTFARDGGRTTVLLTGFGPFPGVPVNATMRLVPWLGKIAPRLFAGVRFVAEILPTEWEAAPACVDTHITACKPDLVIHFGVSGRARGFEIERRGINLRALAPDAAGRIPNDACLADEGPHLHPSRLPVAEIVTRLRRRGVPAFQSWNAGTYLCNATLYHALGADALRGVPTGFVHIPAELAGGSTRTSPGCPLTWGQAKSGSLEILATCLDRPSPPDAAIRRAATGQCHC